MKKQDNDLTQLGKFHHQYKKKDAEINLDGDLQSLAQSEEKDNDGAKENNAKLDISIPNE